MKKFSSLSLISNSFFALALAMICHPQAIAYTIIDQATLNLDLPPGWKLIDISRSPDLVVTNYTKTISNTDQTESLVEAQLTKDNNKAPQAVIQEMMDRTNKQAIQQHCEVLQTTNIPQENDKFQVWMQTFQCKRSLSGIIQAYVDIDPQTLYLFTYTTPHYPFTLDQREKANQLLNASVQVCYKGQGCVELN